MFILEVYFPAVPCYYKLKIGYILNFFHSGMASKEY